MRDSHSEIASALRYHVKEVLVDDTFQLIFTYLVRVQSKLCKAPLAASVRNHARQCTEVAACVTRGILASRLEKVLDFENMDGAFV